MNYRYLKPFIFSCKFFIFSAALIFIACEPSSHNKNGTSEVLNEPSDLQVTAVSSSQLDISWTDNSVNETGFKIERAYDNNGVPAGWTEVKSTSGDYALYNDTGLAASTKYYYRVRAYNDGGYSDYTDPSDATTLALPSAVPDAPSGLAVKAESSTTLKLTWTDNSDNEESFRIERAPDVSGNPGTWSEIKITYANVVLYNDTGLSVSTKYHYRVRSHNSAGFSAYSGVVSGTTDTAVTGARIIADHTVVDKFNNIPQSYIDRVKGMWFSLAGESHSSGYRNGALVLQWQYPKFAVSVTESGTPEAYTDTHLRLSRATWGELNSTSGWAYGYGEEDWFTSSTAIAHTKASISYCNTTGPAISVLGFGWCWDHSVYINSSEITAYLSATQQYIDYCTLNEYDTFVIFTSGPVDNYSGVDAYNRYLSEQQIRAYVLADSSRILFDYADILSWNDAGVENQQSYNGNRYHLIHPDNMSNIAGAPSDANDDHIGQVGAVRLAKAMWWMLARISGWDGVSAE